MNREETAKIMAIMMTTYSNFEPKNLDETINVWSIVFEPYDFRAVQNGLLAYIRNNQSGFAPAPGQIIDYISKASRVDELTPEEAWSMTYKAICKSSYGYKEEFEKLPPLVQKAIGQPERLRDMARDDNFNIGVESSNFMRAYRIYADRKAEDEKTGIDIVARLSRVGMPQIGVANESE